MAFKFSNSARRRSAASHDADTVVADEPTGFLDEHSWASEDGAFCEWNPDLGLHRAKDDGSGKPAGEAPPTPAVLLDSHQDGSDGPFVGDPLGEAAGPSGRSSGRSSIGLRAGSSDQSRAGSLADSTSRSTSGKSNVRHPRLRRTPLLGRLPLKRQVNLLIAIIAVGVTLALGFGAYDSRSTRMFAAQNEVVGDALMHSQRLAKAAGIAVQGSTLAYDQLQDSVKYLTAASEALASGGSVAGLRIAPVPEPLQPSAQRFAQVWREMAPTVAGVIEQEEVLVRFNQLAYQGRFAAAALSATVARAIEAVRRAGGDLQELMLLTQIELYLQTIVAEMNRLTHSSQLRAEDATSLAKGIDDFASARRTALDASAGAGRSALRTPEARNLIQGEAARADAFVISSREAQQAIPALEQARAAGRKVFFGSENLTNSVSAIRAASSSSSGVRALSQWLVVGFSAAALLGLLLLGKAYYDDSFARASEADGHRAEAERLEQETKRLSDQNQSAILRLMNELQEVADGDLTIQATVSDDITGAIADSVNYTVEALRDLVGRINRTAAAVAVASSQAQVTSSNLQASSDQQSREIRETGEAVLSMAEQIKQVSASASESADVARQSLTAAGRGRDAVQSAILGMNGIRDQIQDTAKRIKRLGESSQEIGEIIELISDITEQTNVLALNAAIQAASAGEAGRGFTIVAEEVQRLAERSAHATRQISGLVKAIQTDTHDAVAAMERSTHGVVQGAKLSDDAGTALSSIGQVSQELADLIMRISTTTRLQAQSAESVAQSIQRILLVTEQTGEGTQQTAGSILKLSELAGELRDSVSRFRVQ